MEDKIGQLIGVVDHTFSITNSHDDKVQVAVKVDFSTASDADIKTWLTSNRIIAGQRPWRSLSKDALTKLNGSTFIAQNIGQKVKSYEETKAEAINAFDAMTPEQQAAYIEELNQKAKAEEDKFPIPEYPKK